MKKTLFIFRRDLRLEDNTGLIYALENSETVIPCFIFTPEQIENNPYRSDHCLQFMIECLQELHLELKKKGSQLFLFYGKPHEIVETCIRQLSVDQVVVNRDYTPYSQERDKKIAAICQQHQVPFVSFDDALLHPPEQTVKANGQPYTVFTPFFKNADKLAIVSPKKNVNKNYFADPISFASGEQLYQKVLPRSSQELPVKGGRKAALTVVKDLASFVNYGKERDFPAKTSTTHLSAYLKFTVISPRELYRSLVECFGPHHDLIRALYWRDFFSAIALFFPHVFTGAFHQKYDGLQWNENQGAFLRWCEGTTGFPLVDAGMREMNTTGFMHNRVRMVVASFLTKDLHLNWQWGERYFAQTLVDYDPAVNNGNWQWAASTGCDAQPYFRIFNPWNQQVKFDEECQYIKKWIPELQELPPKEIHEWYKKQRSGLNYPAPMVDHAVESKVALERYSRLRAV